MNFEKCTLQTTSGKPIISFCSPSTSHTSSHIGLARAASDITIEPHQAARFQICLSRVPNDSIVLFEPVNNLSDKYSLAGARLLIKSNKGRAYCEIMNPMPTACQITKSQVIGKLFPVEQVLPFESTDNAPHSDQNSINTFSAQPQMSENDYISIAKQLGINVDSLHRKKRISWSFLVKIRMVLPKTVLILGPQLSILTILTLVTIFHTGNALIDKIPTTKISLMIKYKTC